MFTARLTSGNGRSLLRPKNKEEKQISSQKVGDRRPWRESLSLLKNERCFHCWNTGSKSWVVSRGLRKPWGVGRGSNSQGVKYVLA